MIIGYGKKFLAVLWNNGYTSELCQNWAFYKGNYVYTRFEELCTRSGEVLYTREHKATLSKKDVFKYVDIDEMKAFRDLSLEKKDII